MLGDALEVMPEIAQEHGGADLLFLDGRPSEYMQYLQVKEEESRGLRERPRM